MINLYMILFKMKKILSGGFPHIFMYGKSYSKTGFLGMNYVRYLLLQFINFAATDPELLCFLFTPPTRHTNICRMVAKLKGNIDVFKTLSYELLASDFEDKLKKAARDPYGVFGEYVIKKVKPILQISGRKSFGGSLETYKVVDHIYAMARHFGPASIFIQ